MFKIEIKTAVSFLFKVFTIVENWRQQTFKQTKCLLIPHNQFNYLISCVCVFMLLLLFT